MKTNEIALFCTSGVIQYAASVEAMLAEYNKNGRIYEVRADDTGNQILWHKGHKYSAGTFKAAGRA